MNSKKIRCERFALMEKILSSSQLINLESKQVVRQYGITLPQFKILSLLDKKDVVCISDIIKCQKMTAGNLTVVIKNMIKLDLIVSVVSGDRRYKSIKMTNKGKELYEKVVVDYTKFTASKFKKVSDEELLILNNTLDKLVEGTK
jgi:DNA-binding MarR family transcriptional regulator